MLRVVESAPFRLGAGRPGNRLLLIESGGSAMTTKPPPLIHESAGKSALRPEP